MAVDDWETHYTETGEAYYYNIRTDESTWYDFSSLSIPRVRGKNKSLFDRNRSARSFEIILNH